MNKENEWDLSPLLKGDESDTSNERKVIEKANNAFVKNWRSNDKYLTDVKVLKKALDEYEELMRIHGHGGNEFYYFTLRTSQDQGDPALKSKFNKSNEFRSKLSNNVKFFQLNLAKITENEQKGFLESPLLKDYKHLLETIFVSAKHLLSEEEEKILSLKEKVTYGNWEDLISDFLSREEHEVFINNKEKEKKSFWEIMNLIRSKDKKVRDEAVKVINPILEKHENLAEVQMNSLMEDKKINDELRKFSRPDSERHLDDDIDEKIVDVLLKSVSSKFDIPKRFYKLKAKLEGVKTLKYHERNIPYGTIDKKYSYEESVELVNKSLSKLDEKFSNVFMKFVKEKCIDVFPRKGKRGGAFCIDNLLTQPTYILLNHTEELNDVLTLAHEVGHGINNELMREKQNSLNFGTPKSTAEVASTFMEDFVLEELMKEADDELKLTLMLHKLDDDVSTIFRQVACYMFEQEMHDEFRRKGYLSKEDLGKIFQKHMSAYMGDGVEQSPGSERWWIYWPHIRDFFYTYSYASGLLISKSLQASVRKDKSFIEDVKKFLASGTSSSPKSIFMNLGIDITKKEFWDKGLKEIEDLLNETEELAKKLGKI